MLCDACTEFKKKYEQLRQKGTEQRETGKPLSTGEQRVDVLGTKARAAGFGRSTAAKVEKIKKQKPEFVADIAAGRTTANKVLKKVTSDGVKTKKAENKEKRKKTDRSFSFSSEALIQVRILEPGKFQFTIEDSKNGVINLKMYRKQMAELNTQIEKNLQNDDGFEPAEIPDK
jgi:hypothetical protein